MEEPPLFEIGESCVCVYYGQKIDVYEAKVIGITNVDGVPNYIIHYIKWNSRYDEKVVIGKEAGKLFKGTLEEFREKHGANIPGVACAPTEDSSGAGTSGSGETKSANVKTPKLASLKPLFTKRLIKVLVDDHDKISHGFVTNIPAKVSLDQIMKEYVDTSEVKEAIRKQEGDVEKNEAKLIKLDSATGLIDIFNAVLGQQLLYSEERSQYNELIKQKAKKKGAKESTISDVQKHEFRASEDYGIIHLLRMMANLPELLKLVKWHEPSLDRFMTEMSDLFEFLDKNLNKYHSGDGCYETEGGEHRRAVAAALK